MNSKQRYQELASKWLNNTISPEEKKEFSAWYNADQDNEVVVPEGIADNEDEHKQRILKEINQTIGFGRKPTRKAIALRWAGVAASLFAVLLVGIYLSGQIGGDQKSTLSVLNDIEPGGNKATLTLANGQTIVLDNSEEGEIISETGVVIKKSEEGQLIYTLQEIPADKQSEIQYNIVSTPRGGQYQVVLPDGSHVWLNAASTLEFPVIFGEKERRVKLNGEGYFEISKNRKKPFIVETSKQEIEVLGTHFNVSEYMDEPSSATTLVEGSVSVRTRDNINHRILLPGQQAKVTDSNQIGLSKVDVSEITAWKNGYFHFNDTDIYSIMRQFGRWYDVEVIYDSPQMGNDVYIGKIPRTATLSEALQVLEAVGVHFKIEGRRLFVLH